jgi:RimJ/RimL family protein N-acetyltransferase
VPGAASFVEPVVLRGSRVVLEPYSAGIRAEVQAALDCDPEAWDLFAASGQGENFDSWWSTLFTGLRDGTWIPFAIRRISDLRVVGTTSFLNIQTEKLTVEVGGTFFEPSARGTDVNPESKLLMLSHAFDRGARRVEFLTDARNVRSRAAIAKLGATEEGILRRDRVTWTGHVRDSVIFSVTDLDWPDVRAGLEARLQ